MTKQLDTSPERGLRIDRQAVRIQQHDRFEQLAVVRLHIRLGKELQLLADEFDALTVRAIDDHNVRLQLVFVIVVDFIEEIVYQRALARPRRTVEYNMRDFVGEKEAVEFAYNMTVMIMRYYYYFI